MPELLTQEKYTELMGEVFHVGAGDDARLEMTLVEVRSAGSEAARQATDAGRTTPFSLLFRGPAEPVMPQAIYRLSHKSSGTHDLFLVPIGPDGEGMGYEAVFN